MRHRERQSEKLIKGAMVLTPIILERLKERRRDKYDVPKLNSGHKVRLDGRLLGDFPKGPNGMPD
jgi:hypothetical protein